MLRLTNLIIIGGFGLCLIDCAKIYVITVGVRHLLHVVTDDVLSVSMNTRTRK